MCFHFFVWFWGVFSGWFFPLHLSILQQAGMGLFPLNNPSLPQLERRGQKSERHLNAVAQIHVLLHCNTHDYYHRGHKMGLFSRLLQFPQTAAASWGIWAELHVIPNRDSLPAEAASPAAACARCCVLCPAHPPDGQEPSPGVNTLRNAPSGLWGKGGERQVYGVRVLGHGKSQDSRIAFWKDGKDPNTALNVWTQTRSLMLSQAICFSIYWKFVFYCVGFANRGSFIICIPQSIK